MKLGRGWQLWLVCLVLVPAAGATLARPTAAHQEALRRLLPTSGQGQDAVQAPWSRWLIQRSDEAHGTGQQQEAQGQVPGRAHELEREAPRQPLRLKQAQSAERQQEARTQILGRVHVLETKAWRWLLQRLEQAKGTGKQQEAQPQILGRAHGQGKENPRRFLQTSEQAQSSNPQEQGDPVQILGRVRELETELDNTADSSPGSKNRRNGRGPADRIAPLTDVVSGQKEGSGAGGQNVQGGEAGGGGEAGQAQTQGQDTNAGNGPQEKSEPAPTTMAGNPASQSQSPPQASLQDPSLLLRPAGTAGEGGESAPGTAGTPHEGSEQQQGRVDCPPERREQLYHLTQEALLKHSSVFHSLMPWEPDGERFIVMDCHTGRASNRLPCIQNHLVFAGLLNRSLVVDTLALGPTIHHYNWTLLMDIEHVRKCFGEKAIVTTAEWSAAHQGRRMPIDALLCWNAQCPTKWNWNTTSYDPPTFKRTVNGINMRDPSATRSYGVFQKFYLQEFANITTIFVGDLFKGAGQFPNTITDIYSGTFEDVPFVRHPGCPNGATILPHHDIMAAASEYVQNEFGGEPFLALHWRGGDFWRTCGRNPTACFEEQEVVDCLMNEAKATGVTNFLICSDMHRSKTNTLQKELAATLNVVKAPFKIIVNPVFPTALFGYQGHAKEGVAAYQKSIMTNAFLFLGTNTSTFSRDVIRMRLGLGKAHCRDGYLYR